MYLRTSLQANRGNSRGLQFTQAPLEVGVKDLQYLTNLPESFLHLHVFFPVIQHGAC